MKHQLTSRTAILFIVLLLLESLFLNTGIYSEEKDTTHVGMKDETNIVMNGYVKLIDQLRVSRDVTMI